MIQPVNRIRSRYLSMHHPMSRSHWPRHRMPRPRCKRRPRRHPKSRSGQRKMRISAGPRSPYKRRPRRPRSTERRSASGRRTKRPRTVKRRSRTVRRRRKTNITDRLRRTRARCRRTGWGRRCGVLRGCGARWWTPLVWGCAGG